eukprot:6328348-Pyramimonas_sp.AAC.1
MFYTRALLALLRERHTVVTPARHKGRERYTCVTPRVALLSRPRARCPSWRRCTQWTPGGGRRRYACVTPCVAFCHA